METYFGSLAEALAESKPSMEFHDGGIKEQLFLMQSEDNTLTSFLTRATWQVVNEPELGIRYSTWVLHEAMKRYWVKHQGNVFVYHYNKANGLGYVVPIARMFVLGVEQEGTNYQHVTLSLKYWDIIQDDGRITLAELPSVPGEPFGVFVDVGDGL